MPEHAAKSIEVRIAREHDDEFFYLGYSSYPGTAAVKKALANKSGYRAGKPYANDDGSLTIEWLQAGLGFTKKERQQNFYKYATDLVVPQLEDALQAGVKFNGDLELIKLQQTVITSANGPEGFSVVRRQLGSMSLFVAGDTNAHRAERQITT